MEIGKSQMALYDGPLDCNNWIDYLKAPWQHKNQYNIKDFKVYFQMAFLIQF